MDRNEVWRNIWQKKYDPKRDAPAYARDGYDLFSAQQLKSFFAYFVDKVRPTSQDDVLEVGCGAGALLQELPPCRSLSGVDNSENAITLIRERFKGDFQVADAARLPFKDGSFSLVICFGVFLYFNSLEYARKVCEELIRVTRSGGRVLIGEVNDAEKKATAENVRKAEQAKREKVQLSAASPDQLYCPKDFFLKIAEAHGLKCTFYDEDCRELDFYTAGRYRFSVVIE